MRVALISRAVLPFHGYGGLERHVAALFKYLERAGCDVSLFTSPPAESIEVPDGVRIVPYRGVPWPRKRGFVILDRDTNYLAWSLRAGKVVRGGSYDVVQADGGAGFGYAFAADETSAPLVLHPHGMEEFKAPSLKRTAYLPLRSATRFAARRAAAVLAPDASMKNEVIRYLRVDGAKVVVQPNAVDLEALDATPKAGMDRFGLAGKAPILLTVGRLEANKGFDVMARALSELHDLPYLWVIVGSGPKRAAIEREVEQAGLRARTVFAGAVAEEELAALFDRATVFVHPTLYEGSSMVTLEAMAHRKPVVASSVGGIPDKVVDRESGRLVPPGNVEALTGALRETLKSDGAKLDAWGARGRAIVEARFDWRKRAGELVAFYETLLSSP